MYKRGGTGARAHGWSLYKRSDGKWYLDFDEVDDTYAGTVNHALHASDTPFTATWNADMVVVHSAPSSPPSPPPPSPSPPPPSPSPSPPYFFVTRHATWGTPSPGETQRGFIWGQGFDSEEEVFAKFAEYDNGPYATGVWNEQVTELKYYGVRGVAEELKEWVREEINA